MLTTPVETEPSVTSVRGGALLERTIPVVLLMVAAAGWWWSARMSDQDMSSMALASFALAWAAMMAAMMFPAIVPVVRLYGLAAARGRAAPLPFFVSGYLLVWTLVGIPAYAASQALMMPLMDGRPWAGRLAGAVMLVAATWQVTPLKDVCLRHCRTPLGFFMRLGTSVARAPGAVKAGALHGSICVGCCWALMAVLVTVGTMNLAWMAGLAGLIFLEKNAPHGERIARVVAGLLVVTGLVLLAHPASITALT